MFGRCFIMTMTSSSMSLSRTPCAKESSAGAHQALRILELEDVRGDAKPVGVRLLDDGAIDFRGQLLVLAAPVIDPDLDDIDLAVRQLLHRLAASASV